MLDAGTASNDDVDAIGRRNVFAQEPDPWTVVRDLEETRRS